MQFRVSDEAHFFVDEIWFEWATANNGRKTCDFYWIFMAGNSTDHLLNVHMTFIWKNPYKIQLVIWQEEKSESFYVE